MNVCLKDFVLRPSANEEHLKAFWDLRKVIATLPDARCNANFLYAVLFDHGGVKLGVTRSPRTRMYTYLNDSIVAGSVMTKLHISEGMPYGKGTAGKYRGRYLESKMLAKAREIGVVYQGSEWFARVPFDQAVEIVAATRLRLKDDCAEYPAVTLERERA